MKRRCNEQIIEIETIYKWPIDRFNAIIFKLATYLALQNMNISFLLYFRCLSLFFCRNGMLFFFLSTSFVAMTDYLTVKMFWCVCFFLFKIFIIPDCFSAISLFSYFEQIPINQCSFLVTFQLILKFSLQNSIFVRKKWKYSINPSIKSV